MKSRIISAVSCGVVMVALIATLLCQHACIQCLKAEVQALRRQAALAASSPDQREETTNPQPDPNRVLISQPQATSSRGVTEGQFQELLRLRGMVGMLNRKLAEAAKPDLKEGASQLPPAVSETSKPTQELIEEYQLSATLAQEKAAIAKEVLDVLATAVNVPQSAAQIEGVEIVDALKDPSLAPYQLYLRFKLESFQLGNHADAERARAEGARAALQTSQAQNSAP